LGIGKFVSLFSIIILSIVITQPIFAERQIEVITEFDKEAEQMILTLKGTDFYPDLEILWVIVHDVGIDFTIANGKTNSDAQGNFLDSSSVKLFAESGNYIIRVIDVERHEFKERLELNDFPDDAISWTLTPKNFKVGESTVIDINGTVNVDIDYNRDVMIRVDQPDHQWAAVAERVSLTDDNKFHIAKNVSFRVPGEHLVIIEHNGLIRQNSFTVFTDEPEPESLCGAGTVFDPATNSCVLDKCGTGTVLKDGVCVLQEPEPESRLPEWVRNIFVWYAEGQIEEDDLIAALQFLIRQGIIVV